MSTYYQHYDRAIRNDDLLKNLRKLNRLGRIFFNKSIKRFPDWYISIAFHSATQHFEAMLAEVKPKILLPEQGTPSTGRKILVAVEHTADTYPYYGINFHINAHGGSEHRSRLRMIEQSSVFDGLRDAYCLLNNYNRTGKYNNYVPNKRTWILAERWLTILRDECRSLIFRSKSK